MGRRLYVGNLPDKATDDALTQLFSSAGSVTSARVMRDMATGRARGFGFVEMATDDAAQKAGERFHQYEMEGRPLVVNDARPKPEGGAGRSFGGSGGDDFGGGAGGRREPRW